METAPNAQPAPAQSGTAATPPPVAAAPSSEPPKPEPKPEPKKTGRARHAEISAKLKASAAATPPPEKKDGDQPPAAGAKTPEPKKPDDGKPDRSPGAVMRLTSEVTRLTKELETAKATAAAPKGDDSIAALRARVKKDPAVLLDVFGDDLGDDKDKRLERLNDAVLERGNPERKAASEADERVSRLEKELADEKAKRQGEEATARDVRARAHCEKALTEGLKGADGSTIVDPAKYPYINHLTKVGEVDAHQGVMLAVRALAKDFRTTKQRDPSDDEVAQMIALCADKAEPIFAKRAVNYQLPKPASADPAAPTERKPPSTITASMGSGHGGGVEEGEPKKLTRQQKHQQIRDRLRKATAQATAN